MYCQSCGYKLEDGCKFCSGCGRTTARKFELPSSTQISDGSTPGQPWGMGNPIGICTPDSTASISTTSKYTPRTYDFWQRNGSRAPPPSKKSKTSKKSQKLLKTFFVSQYVGTPETNQTLDPKDQIDVIIPIKVDLRKLEEYNDDFSINDIQREIGFELSTIEKMVILYQDGYLVKDSANTRGLAAWDNKVKYRAVNMESHKLYRKASYDLIKFEYNEFSDSSDEETVTGKAENKKKVDAAVGSKVDDAVGSKVEAAVGSKVDTSTLLNSVNSKFEEFIKLNTAERSLKDKIRRVFDYTICYVPRPNCFYCCPNCGRYLGCFHCMKRLSSCRGPFVNQVKAFFIPGIEEVVDIPPYIPDAPEHPINIMDYAEENDDQSTDSET
ncbi:uncharacterized protein [Clytia hemisphaerica]|uniref:uncharacterized protein n=1 Tax=Clytia hemisphaerica TaxID=252671 RepID=UPI0034D63819